MGTMWNPPVELSTAEKFIAKRCGKRRGFVFLRELRHRLFDEAMQTTSSSPPTRKPRGARTLCRPRSWRWPYCSRRCSMSRG
jgi:hypothetical protein